MAQTLFELYKSRGQALPGLKERAKTFEELGLGPALAYKGTTDQNVSLLKRLDSIPPTPPKPVPVQPVKAPGTPSAPPVAPNLPPSAPIQPGPTSSTPSAPIADRYEKLLGDLETTLKGVPSKSKLYTDELFTRNVEPQRQQLRSLDERISAMERAIDESEEDIRKRTIQSGGLVTESQTQRLVASEKEPLLRSYRNLINERNRLAQQVGEEESRAGTIAGLKYEEALQPLETLKTRLGLEKDLQALKVGGKPISVGGNLVQYNPETGKFDVVFEKPTSDLDLMKLEIQKDRLEIAKDQARTAQEKAELQNQLNEINFQIKSLDLEQKKSAAEIRPQYLEERATRIASDIDGVMPRVNYMSAGFVGKQSEGIAGTPAYNLARDIESIKANIGFNELQQMREASKTGGALGQIAVQELNFLQSVLGSLDIGQGPDQLKANLEKVKQSVQRWSTAKGTKPGGGQNNDPLGIR